MQMFEEFMKVCEWPAEQQEKTMSLLSFLVKRARGEINTGAKFLRDFITNHDKYEKDSKLNDDICFDLLKVLSSINDPDCEHRKDLLGEYA